MLTESDILTLAEITRIDSAVISAATVSLSAAREDRLLDEVDAWEVVRDKFASAKGGHDGVVYDPESERAAIRDRVFSLLRLTPASGVPTYDLPGSTYVTSVVVW